MAGDGVRRRKSTDLESAPRYGSPQKAVEVLQKPESDAALHLPEHTLRRIRQTGEAQVEEMLARCEKLRLSILWYGDEAYPPQLLSIVNPPVLLFYQGDSSLLQEHLLLTIVGTRNPSPYSLQVERHLPRSGADGICSGDGICRGHRHHGEPLCAGGG